MNRHDMDLLFHQLLDHATRTTPGAVALSCRGDTLTYEELSKAVTSTADGLSHLGIPRGERVAIYLPKQWETVIGLFATAQTGGIFVPVNPVLKPLQVVHILRDSGARVLITSAHRAHALRDVLPDCPALQHLVLVDDPPDHLHLPHGVELLRWRELQTSNAAPDLAGLDDTASAAILYTSGSTGRPKGVELSHRNLVLGAKSVAQYLDIRATDRLLAVLPFSFDYGLNQLSTAFLSGARVELMNYLLPKDIPRAVAREGITGLAGVPPLWVQLAALDWPGQCRESLRYITNSGGHLPRTVLATLQQALPDTAVYLMYGLTEAFRSTYLPPAELARRPGSMGHAIPHAEIRVLRENGTPCAPGEPGELVHLGPLVAKGYWNQPEASALRFRPVPGVMDAHGQPVPAVWSGDTVQMDEDGFLYFLGRHDDQIKTSGYRISPAEVEEVLYACEQVHEAAVIGVPDPALGQAIVAMIVLRQPGGAGQVDDVTRHCQALLPGYLMPRQILSVTALPRTPHGKIDRQRLLDDYATRQDAVAS